MTTEVVWFWTIFLAALVMVGVLIAANYLYNRNKTDKNDDDLLEVLEHRREVGDISNREYENLKQEIKAEKQAS